MGLLSCVSQKFVGDWEGSQLGQVTPKGNFTPSEDHAQCSELPGRVWFGEGAGIAQQVVSSYIVHQLFGWVFQFLFLTSLLAMLLYFILFPIIKLLFSQPANSTSDSPPHSTGVREKRRGLSGFAVLHFHLVYPVPLCSRAFPVSIALLCHNQGNCGLVSLVPSSAER